MKNFKLLVLFSSFLFSLLPGVAMAELTTGRADSKAFILPTLELTVSEQGAQELSFGGITPSSLGPTEAPLRTILIDVHSNVGEKYQLTQALNGELQNIEGQTILLDHLKFKTMAVKSTGIAIPDFIAVAQSTQTIFTSDDKGTSESITALYRLTIPPSQAPGDYSAMLTYTVSSV